MRLADIEEAVREAGFTARGAFHPRAEDVVPDIAPGRVVGTLFMVGNAGADMWQAFTAVCDPERDRIDDWSARVLGALAAEFGAVAVFPFSKPALPFQRWAQRAEACQSSPVGIVMHPEFGLWHAYRGALVFAERLDLPVTAEGPDHCATCDDKPCLITCPVAAFKPGVYDVAACASHIDSVAGQDCMDLGCRARRACPVGRAYRYQPAQARFHMTAFLRGLPSQ
jgi:hypothetical protein